MFEQITHHQQQNSALWQLFCSRITEEALRRGRYLLVASYTTGAFWSHWLQVHISLTQGGIWVSVSIADTPELSLKGHFKPYDYLLGFHLWAEVIAWQRNAHRHEGCQPLLPQMTPFSTEWNPVSIDPYTNKPLIF